LQHISAPVEHLTAQGDDIFKFDVTKIHPVVLWGCVKGEFLPFVFPYCRESLRNQKSKNQIRTAGEIKLSPGALICCPFLGEIFTKSSVNKNDNRKLKLL
jgi:hypothetical protein